MTRLKTGVKVGSSRADDAVEDAVVAQWVVVTDILRNIYNMSMTLSSSAAPPTATPSPILPTPTADRDTAPKTLPANVHKKLVQDYKKIQLGGRSFFPGEDAPGSRQGAGENVP